VHRSDGGDEEGSDGHRARKAGGSAKPLARLLVEEDVRAPATTRKRGEPDSGDVEIVEDPEDAPAREEQHSRAREDHPQPVGPPA
jgi:hypothetical protein